MSNDWSNVDFSYQDEADFPVRERLGRTPGTGSGTPLEAELIERVYSNKPFSMPLPDSKTASQLISKLRARIKKDNEGKNASDPRGVQFVIDSPTNPDGSRVKNSRLTDKSDPLYGPVTLRLQGQAKQEWNKKVTPPEPETDYFGNTV